MRSAEEMDAAISMVKEAQAINAQLQKAFAVGSQQWHSCESIDDKLHAALEALGD